MSNKPLSARRLKLDTLKDIRRNNNFVVSIEDITDSNESISLVINKAFLPKVSNQVLEIRHGNDSIKLAGVATWQGGTISFHDVLEESILKDIIKWRERVYNPATGAIGRATDYKKSGTIKEVAPDGTFGRTWAVEGMWISELDLGTLDASDGATKEISMTIQIDPPKAMSPVFESED